MKRMAVWFLLCAVCLSGCASMRVGADLSATREQQSAPPSETAQERAAKIKEALLQTDGIVSAAVVIEGGTAIIGLTLEQGGNEQALKREADRAAREADEAVEHTSITSRGSLVTMIQQLEEEKSAGA